MRYARRALIVAWKDLVVERRSKETLNALLFFSLALLFVFQFTLGPDRERLAAVLPGVLWLGFILSGVLGLGRTFLVERDNDRERQGNQPGPAAARLKFGEVGHAFPVRGCLAARYGPIKAPVAPGPRHC